MKKQELVTINFTHKNVNYSARVFKGSITAIILPNKTVLVTTVIKAKHVYDTDAFRGGKGQINFGRQIFDITGRLNPLKILYRPGDWTHPLEIHFPHIFAEPI